MSRVDEFDAFYAASRRELLHQAYALTGDRTAAAAAVEDAYAHAWQRWPKLRTGDPIAYVRPEAWRFATLRHSTHLLRRRHHGEADAEVLEALAELSTPARRLVLLQTLAGLDLPNAAREVGVTTSDAVQLTDAAVDALLSRLGGTVAQLEGRLHALRRTTDALTLPRASRIRRVGRQRQRRNTLVAVAATVAALVGSGVFVTAGVPAAADRDRLAGSRQPDGESQPEPEPPPGVSEDKLLGVSATKRLDPRRHWQLKGTSSDLARRDPYAPCQERRFADARLREAWLRRFAASGPGDQRLVQAVEVSRNRERAAATADRMLQWYAGCDQPRMQLVDAHAIRRDGPDGTILTLHRWSRQVRTITVGVLRSGVVTTMLVHLDDGLSGPRLQRFGDVMNETASSVCSTSGGRCDSKGTLRDAPLPPTGEGRGFLGAVDLQPLRRLTEAWVGTDPGRSRPNPSATLCDAAEFTGPGVVRVRARVFVVPEAKALPEQFGLSETVAEFRSAARAAAFLQTVTDRIERCPDRILTAEVAGPTALAPAEGAIWRISYEVTERRSVRYWLGFVRDGKRLAQVAFPSVRGFDLTEDGFADLMVRAGERLRELR